VAKAAQGDGPAVRPGAGLGGDRGDSGRQVYDPDGAASLVTLLSTRTGSAEGVEAVVLRDLFIGAGAQLGA
jgi:hypothetical protein